MDVEIAAGLVILTSLFSAASGFFFRRKRIIIAPSTYVVDSTHEHHGVHVDSHGWRCICGEHVHRYSMPVTNEPGAKQCACGDRIG